MVALTDMLPGGYWDSGGVLHREFELGDMTGREEELLVRASGTETAHVIVLGPSFTGHRLTQVVWSVAWAGTAGVVLAYRVGLPVLRSFRYRLRVAEGKIGGAGAGSGRCLGEHTGRV